MLSASYFISPQDLWSSIGTAVAPRIIDGRRRDGMLRQGFVVYDGLLAWLRHAASERHNRPAKAL